MLWISKHVVIGFLVFASCTGCGRTGCSGSPNQAPAPEEVREPAPAPKEVSQPAPVVEETAVAGSTGITMRSMPDGRCGWKRVAVQTGKAIASVAELVGPCPKDWSLSIHPDGKQGLLMAHTLWLIELNTAQATELSGIGTSAHSVVWREGLPTVSGETPGSDANGDAADKYFEERGLPLIFCQDHSWVNGKWVADGTVREVHPSEGHMGPFCNAESDDGVVQVSTQMDTHGEEWGGGVEEALLPGLKAMTKTTDGNIDWVWANQGETGGIAISTMWNEGAHMTGLGAAWNGTQWKVLEPVVFPITSAKGLSSGDTYLCASNGYGVFDTDTGTARYWEEGTCLGLDSWVSEPVEVEGA